MNAGTDSDWRAPLAVYIKSKSETNKVSNQRMKEWKACSKQDCNRYSYHKGFSTLPVGRTTVTTAKTGKEIHRRVTARTKNPPACSNNHDQLPQARISFLKLGSASSS